MSETGFSIYLGPELDPPYSEFDDDYNSDSGSKPVRSKNNPDDTLPHKGMPSFYGVEAETGTNDLDIVQRDLYLDAIQEMAETLENQ